MKSKKQRLIYVLMIGLIFTLLNIHIIDFHDITLKNDENLKDKVDFNIEISGHWGFNGTTFVISNWASSASSSADSFQSPE